MERSTRFEAESLDRLIERFQAHGLETLNLGYICFRFSPALREINLVSVLTKISRMLHEKEDVYVQDGKHTSWHFNFYASFIQYLMNRNIKFELYYMRQGRTWLEKLNLAILCRQLGSYRRAYEKKIPQYTN